MQTNHLARNAMQLHAGSSVNLEGTCVVIDTKLAQPGSPSVRYQLISPTAARLGIYDTALEAASAAGGFWPGVCQRSDDNGADGWDIEVVRDTH